jgi:hypothetical protein
LASNSRHDDQLSWDAHPPAAARRRRAAPLAIALLLGLAALLLLVPLRGAAQSQNPVAAAVAKARTAGSYTFSGDMLQETVPSSTVTNVGHTSRTDQLYLEGQVSAADQTAEIRVWSQDGSVLQSADGLGIRVEGGKTFVREGAGAWREQPGAAESLAPQGDLMGYLGAARDVQAHPPETRAGRSFTRLTFRLDGPALAAYMRERIEESLRRQAGLPPGAPGGVPGAYTEISGSGELWVGEDGLPLRQILALRFPEQGGETTSAQITITFSNFGQPDALAGFLSSLSESSTAPAGLGLALLVLALAWALARYQDSPRLLKGLSATLVVILVAGPLLQSLRVRSFLDVQAAQAAEQEVTRAEQSQMREMRANLSETSFDPHADPLAAVQPPDAPVAAAALPEQPLDTETGIDTDGDGLTDYQELRINTDPTFADSDEDGVPDGVEARGVVFAGQTWYLDPNSVDTNRDGIGDGQEWDLNGDGIPDDTDGDGIPDAFDNDNDGDGVPDALDLAPFTRIGATFGESTPFRLSVNNLTAGKPTFVEFQLRPTEERHLWFAFNLLDWPSDTRGQVRDIDNQPDDMQLIPMLEIRIPNSGLNLPPQRDLAPYNVTVSDLVGGGATKVAYVPLNIITDEKTGQRVAFAGKMPYLPTGSWPAAHEVRLVWVVQMQLDVPCDPSKAEARARGCTAQGLIYNSPQVIQSYYDSWTLTGLTVTEEHGASVAIMYEDPAVDADKRADTAIDLLSGALDNAFLSARDANNDGRRDVDLAEIVRRFDRTTNAGVSEEERSEIPNILRVERRDYPTVDRALSSTAMTETVRILNTNFSGWLATIPVLKPTLMFAQETSARSVGLDTLRGGGGYAAFAGDTLTVNFSPGGQTPIAVLTTAHLQKTSYCPTGNSIASTWNTCSAEQWWNELELRANAIPPPAGADPDVEAGRTLIMHAYDSQLRSGLSRVVQVNNQLTSSVYSLKSDGEYASIVRSVAGGGVSAIRYVANQLIMARYVNQVTVLKQLGITYRELAGGKVSQAVKYTWSVLKDFRTGGHVNRLIGTSIVAGVVTMIGLAITLAVFVKEGNPIARAVATSLSLAFTLAISVISPIKTTVELIRGATTLLGSQAAAVRTVLSSGSSVLGTAKAAGVIGNAIAAAVTWGFFIYSMVSNRVAAFSPEFNRALAETIAATLYIVFLAVLSATVIGTIFVALIAFVDAILSAICALSDDSLLEGALGPGQPCFTLGAAAVKGIAYWTYNYSPMINTDRADLLVLGSPITRLANPSLGYVAGNAITVSMPVTTTAVHKDPDPKDGVLIYPYMWLYSPDNLRSTTFAYTLTGSDAQTLNVGRGQIPSLWQNVREDRKYLVSPMYRGTLRTTPERSGILLPAGLDREVPLTLNMGYALPAYECWGVLILGVCYTRTVADSNSSTLDPVVFDILPATLSGFMTMAGDTQGRRQSWDPRFPILSDSDGDGLTAKAFGGMDPDDTNPDTDGDGLTDAFEEQRRVAGAGFNSTLCDTDGDGLTDGQEFQLGTDPSKIDTDGDGLLDSQEVRYQVFNTITCQPTSQWAGGWDVTIPASASPNVPALTVRAFSNPNSTDSDNDGISDAAEKLLSEDPNPANRLDPDGRPYHPSVVNSPPIAVFTDSSDPDGVVGLSQTFAYTSTIVTRRALNPSPLEVILPPGLGNTTLNATLPFNPVTFTGVQTATQASQVTVAANATSGTQTITSRVTGQLAAGGTIIQTGSLPIVIDATPPSSAVTSLQNEQYVRGTAPGRPTKATVIIGGTASDASSEISKVEVSVNGGAWQLADGSATWTFPLQVDDGVFVVQTRATDSVGNVETPGPGIKVRADGVGPDINLPDRAATVPTRTASGQWSVPVSGNVSDRSIGPFGGNGETRPGSGLVAESVQVRVRLEADEASINPWQPVTIAPDGSWSATYLFPASVADPTGIYRVEVRARDTVGNQLEDFGELSLDPTAPVVTLSAQDTARTVITGTVTLSGVISDTDLTVNFRRLNVGVDTLEASFAPLDQVVPLSEAVLRLPFDEPGGVRFYTDVSGRGNHAVCDQPSCPTTDIGRADRGLVFGGEQPLRVADSAGITFDAQASFTVAGWIKTFQTEAVLARKGRGQQSYQLGLFGGAAAFTLANGTTTVRASGGPALNDGNWHFIVGTVDRASGQARLYVDGVLHDSEAVSGSFASTDPLQIGGQTEVTGEPPQFLLGSIDEVTIIARALSAAEVSALRAAADRQWFPATLAQRGAGVSRTTWSLPIPAGLEGEYQLDVRSRDMLGNRIVTAKLWRGVVDTRAPRVALTAQPTGALFFDSSANAYRAAVEYVCGAEDRYLNEASFTCPGTNLPPATRSFDSSPIFQGLFPDLTVRNGLARSYSQWEPVGSLTHTASACDLNGNCTTTNTPVNLAPGALDAPQAAVVSPAPSAIIAASGPVSVQVVAEANQPLREVTLSLDGTVVDTATFTQAANVTRNQRTVSVTVAGEGQHTLVARATDWTGRVQTTLFPVTFTLDTQAPALTLDESPLTVGDSYGPGSDVLRFNGTASDTIGLAAVQISVNGQPFADVTFGGGTWRTALPITDPEGRVLSVTVRATDLAGRVTEVTRSVPVSITTANPPDTTITGGPSNPSFSGSATFTFTATPGERGIGGFACRLDGGPFETCSSPQTYRGLSRGAHTFEVRAIDTEGFVDLSPASSSWTITDAPTATPTSTPTATPAATSTPMPSPTAPPAPASGRVTYLPLIGR